MDDAIVRHVLLEVHGQPLAKSIPVGRTDALRIAAQQAHIPDLSLVARVARIGQQPVDQFFSLLLILVGEKRGRLLVRRNHADQVEIDSPQKHRVSRPLRR